MIEDAAEALGARYKGRTPGTFGGIGIYSFNGNKIITSTGGGMLVAQRKEWVDKARYWSTQARDPGVNYLHSKVGYNYRLSNVLAGIARGQLEVLELRVQQRRAVFDRYAAAFADLPGVQPQPEAGLEDHGTTDHRPQDQNVDGDGTTRPLARGPVVSSPVVSSEVSSPVVSGPVVSCEAHRTLRVPFDL